MLIICCLSFLRNYIFRTFRTTSSILCSMTYFGLPIKSTNKAFPPNFFT
nr:MAG TPA: hypothetical protein [Caudoviricetes sp.]